MQVSSAEHQLCPGGGMAVGGHREWGWTSSLVTGSLPALIQCALQKRECCSPRAMPGMSTVPTARSLLHAGDF